VAGGTGLVERPPVTAARRVSATLLLAFLCAGAVQADDPSDADAARTRSRARAGAVERALPAIVFVRVAESREGGGAPVEGYGAGIVVRADGRVLTCGHVLGAAEEAKVKLRDGREFRARRVADDPGTDLALLALDAEGLELPVATIGDEASVDLGESVVAVGSPFGLGWSVSAGVLSAKGRRNVVANNVAPLLQTDAPLNPGSSGGPLLDLGGEVIGLVNAILTRSGGDQGLGFAVPSSEIRRVLPSLLEGKRPSRGWIGIDVRIDRPASAGVEIEAVVRDGPAARAGVRQGDRVVSVDGVPITRVDDLRRVVREARDGSTLDLEIARGDAAERLRVRVAERPTAPSLAPQRP